MGHRIFGNTIWVFVYKTNETFALKGGSLKNLGVVGQWWLHPTEDVSPRFIISMQQI